MNLHFMAGTITTYGTTGRSFIFDYCTATTTSAADNIWEQHAGTNTGEYFNVGHYIPIRFEIPTASQPRPEQRSELRPEQQSELRPEQQSELRPEQQSELRPEQQSELRPEQQQPKPDPDKIETQKKAQELARRLLLEYLEPNNKQRYIEKKPIEVDSRLFNDIKYQIPISKLDKICAVKNGQIISRLCLIVKEPEYIPLEDVVLTKLLHILYDEECVLRTANHSSIAEDLLARLN